MKSDAKCAKDGAIREGLFDGCCRTWREKRIGVDDDDGFVKGRVDAAIDLRGTEAFAGDHASAATHRDGDGVIGAPAVSHDHFGRARHTRGVDRRGDGRRLVERRNDHADGHCGDANVSVRMNAYILIGGRSRRMGVSKTDLFLDRVVAAASPVFDEIVAVQRFGGEAVAIRTIFEEPHQHEGAIFGVVRALHDVHERDLSQGFVLAVDYPMITADVLRYVCDRGGVPEWDGCLQPLCAVWDARALPRIEERMARGQLDLHGMVDREMIPESELRARFHGEPLRNVNTGDEWEAVRSNG